jgi:hypothetical protein
VPESRYDWQALSASSASYTQDMGSAQ